MFIPIKAYGANDMKGYIKDGDKETRILQLSGELVIQHAEELRSLLLESLENKSNIEIDLSMVTDADISSLQLLCSAHKTSIFQSKSLKFIGKISDAFRQNVETSGFYRTKGCSLDRDKQCFWIKENYDW